MVFSFARSVVFTALVLVFAASYSECQSACSIPCVQNVVDVACSESLCGENAHASDRTKYLCHIQCKHAIMGGLLGDCLSEERMPRIRQKLIENTLKALVINTCRANAEADDKQTPEVPEIPGAVLSMIDRLGVLAPKDESTANDGDSIAADDGEGDNATDTGASTDDKWEVVDPIYSDDSFKASGPLASIEEVFDIDNLDFNMTQVEDDADTADGDLEGDEDVSDDVSVEEMDAEEKGKRKRKGKRKVAKKDSDDDEEEENDDDDDGGRKRAKKGGRRKSSKSSDDGDDDDDDPRKRRLNDSDDDEEEESDDDDGNDRRRKAKNGKRRRRNRGDDDSEDEEDSDDDDEGRKVTGGRKKHQPRRGNKGKKNQKGGKRNGKNKGKGKKNQKKNEKKGDDDDDEGGDDDDSAPTSPVPSSPLETNTTVPVGAQPEVAAPPVDPIDPPTDQENEGMVKETAPAPSGTVFEGGVPYESEAAAPLSDQVPMPEIENVVEWLEPVSGGVTEGPMSEDEQILMFLERGMH